ncbi:MAG: winged helix DNA-binding domain-containing protein [Proteobacteria bacterium]|nr:winged helix DNA-binding domain-containing protein [Pseudomonadota bacterium]
MPRRSDSLSLKQARRIAIAAQGFDLAGHGEGRGSVAAEKRHLRRMIERLGVVQIDSVNVVARAHTLPGFSRLGPYATADIDALAYSGRRRVLFEYWGHEASYLPVALQPLFRFRMARAAAGAGIYTGLARFGRERRQLIDEVHREIERHGPMSASELSHDHKGEGGWWGWSEGKMAVEWLFWAGMVTTATRRGAFERIYDVTERVLPQAVLDVPTPSDADANRELVRLSSSALGIATERCLRDYYRLEVADTKAAVADLVESGDLIPVSVEGFRNPAYLAKDARMPRKVEARALLAPFDPLVWQRERTEGLFGARIRLEIYTPAEKRVHGYYVLPFLLGDTLAGRVDLKADRAGSVLVVQASHLEDGAKAADVAGPLAAELRLMARWLGLSDVRAEPRGDLAKALGEALAA